MRKILKIAFAIILIISLTACGIMNNEENSYEGNYDAGVDNISDGVVDNNDNDVEEQSAQAAGVDSDSAGSDALIIIEISEDKIFFDGNEISLTELEGVIHQFSNPEYKWELHDVHHAVKTVYDDVVELLNEYSIAFREIP